MWGKYALLSSRVAVQNNLTLKMLGWTFLSSIFLLSLSYPVRRLHLGASNGLIREAIRLGYIPSRINLHIRQLYFPMYITMGGRAIAYIFINEIWPIE